ncbi:hypothetical protein PWT90_10794 [Aphanocladium album]|nr:hypothetical protein PWT90_10794 [Aphanocladium album]
MKLPDPGNGCEAPERDDIPRPQHDTAAAAILSSKTKFHFPTNAEEAPRFHQELVEMMAPLVSMLKADKNLTIEERTIPGPRGEIPLVVLQSSSPTPQDQTRPGILFLHGGAMIAGDGFSTITQLTGMAHDINAVIISVDYRRAPEYQDVALVEDCYAALVWVGERLDKLGIDKERLMIAGCSAGGGLAAGTALKARDEGGPKLCAQLLSSPMLDDRTNTNSALQFMHPEDESGLYNTTWNRTAWKLVLGDRAGGDDVSYYVAPARATDLSGLPEAYIDVGSAEPFRDEATAYALNLWKSGSQANLHVWAGGWHGFDFTPGLDFAETAVRTRNDWIRKMLVPK